MTIFALDSVEQVSEAQCISFCNDTSRSPTHISFPLPASLDLSPLPIFFPCSYHLSQRAARGFEADRPAKRERERERETERERESEREREGGRREGREREEREREREREL